MKLLLGIAYMVSFVLTWLTFGWTLALLVFVCYVLTMYVLNNENLP